MSNVSERGVDLEQLRALVAETLDVDEANLTDEAHFVDELEVDSLMALEVMVVLEKQYQVKLDESELKNVTTLRKAHDMLEDKLGAGA